MISSVQALLIGLTLIFDSLEKEKRGILESGSLILEHFQDPNSVEYKKWMFENFDELASNFTIDKFEDSEILITEYGPDIFQKIRN